ncbi:exodeoxyribonuclease VII large subunit [Microbulbifer thermotolerans]|uniref:exodeoxyribonuclease VII large subunit n=1 Tax=Microbulbifer thermotolerans TaxID=252514 RepID=UPI00224919BC|nr:exodeoxyribonuclease VII large subunit [Microbulbifer thermotolerans]MCX2793724.1 exodeoxyribonuclease VII large subunit [Microbulbifer thermotolerans]WKT61763.1 exodeoxyribonuclease VII large subunit [Microbulbifer thermotolerans]
MPDNSAIAKRSVLSVSDLNREIKQLLEGTVPLLWVSGEISNFAAPSSGHWYFTLKDARAQVRCAMFRGRNRNVAFRPENGREVLVRARAGLYEGRGEFQLIVEHMEEAGFGALMRRLEQLKARLQAEGLFALSRKKSLPRLPGNIGIVTSPTGAAVRDMIQVLGRRFPAAEIEIWPVQVQGAGAAQQIADAITKASRSGRHDLLIVGRGGGSLEDLWPFNEEVVARALAACDIPTISAVGHETDTTIADLVADLRAPTPSAAAEIASRHATELLQTLQNQRQRLIRAAQSQLRHMRQQLQITSARLRHPREQLQNRTQRLDHLEMRLHAACRQQLQSRREELRAALRAFAHCHPERSLQLGRERLSAAAQKLQRAVQLTLRQRRELLSHRAQLLHNVSPLAVLQRGYAIVQDDTGRVIKSSCQLHPGQSLRVRLAEGHFSATVKETEG